MRRSILSVFFLVTCSPLLVQADIYSSQSYGDTEAYAREQVLLNLASNLHVKIESESQSIADNKSGLTSTSKTKAIVDLPVLGAQVDCFPKGAEYTCHGLLNSEISAPLYASKLTQLREKILEQANPSTAVTQDVREQSLMNAASLMDDWARYLEVLHFLSPSSAETHQLNITKAEILSRLEKSQRSSESIPHAMEQFAQNFDYQSVFVFPPRPEHSNEITQFSRFFKASLESRLSGQLVSQQRARFYLRGSYSKTEDGLSVHYKLLNKQGDTVDSRIMKLAPKAYQGLQFEPTLIDFDQMLHSGYAVSSDLNVQIRTDRGQSDLAFSLGESVELFVKLNRSGYFYLVGHTKTRGIEKSYLLDLQDAPGNRKFINYVNADDANRWISLGEFEVQPPFGVESLQIIASSKDLVDAVPNTSFDGSYYLISNNLKEGVALTRGLVKKKKKAEKLKPAEAVLMFSTFPN